MKRGSKVTHVVSYVWADDNIEHSVKVFSAHAANKLMDKLSAISLRTGASLEIEVEEL